MTKVFKTGAIPSPENKRNWRLPMSTSNVPKEWGSDDLLPGWVIDQKQSNCVAQSCNYIAGAQWNKKFDPNWNYGRRSPEDYQGEGMHLHRALHFMLHDGNVPKGEYSKSELEVTNVQDWVNSNLTELLPIANGYKIKSYYQVWTPQEMKIARMKGYYLMFSAPINTMKVDNKDRYRVKMPPSHGYHCMTAWYWKIIDGKEEWRVLNSWGKGWADNGKCWMDAWDILQIQDCWAVEIGPDYDSDEVMEGNEVRYSTTIKTSAPDKMAIVRLTSDPKSEKVGNAIYGEQAIVIGESGERREIVTTYKNTLIHGWIHEDMLMSGKNNTNGVDEE